MARRKGTSVYPYRMTEGYTQLVAPQSVHQPPFAIRWRGKWYRADYALRDAILARFDPLDFGHRRMLDYLSRARKHYLDLPVLPPRAITLR